MNVEKAKKLYEEKENAHIPQHKKFWYSITKFERYPEMAAEGVGRAFSYFAWLMLMFSIILAIAFLIKFYMFVKNGVQYLDNNFSEIEYKQGNLSVKTQQEKVATDFGYVVINTSDLTNEQTKEYENLTSSKLEFIWLKDRVIANYGPKGITIFYSDVLNDIGIKEFNKASLIEFLNNKINSPQIYVGLGIVMMIYMFIAYFITTLFDIIVLSIFGVITSFIAKIQMRYRAVFNMAVYSITISTILQLIYNLIQMFTRFNIKYFDIMYMAISFICLTAAIFMIKSDVIRQQMELMKVLQNKNAEQENIEENEKREDKKEENDEDTENKKSKKEKKEKEESQPDIEGQGSNA